MGLDSSFDYTIPPLVRLYVSMAKSNGVRDPVLYAILPPRQGRSNKSVIGRDN
jgi:hypothetical protein